MRSCGNEAVATRAELGDVSLERAREGKVAVVRLL
jgi:hypothetical protein